MRVNYENNYTKLGLHHAYWGHTYAPTDGKLYIFNVLGLGGLMLTLLGLDCVERGGLLTAGEETEDITENAELLAEWLSDDWDECEE